MNNFLCIKCSNPFFVAQYTFSIRGDKTIYKYKTTGKSIICPECKCEDIDVIQKDGDFTTLQLGKYSMQSIPDRQESLKQRSHDHFEREIKDKQREINKSATLGTLG